MSETVSLNHFKRSHYMFLNTPRIICPNLPTSVFSEVTHIHQLNISLCELALINLKIMNIFLWLTKGKNTGFSILETMELLAVVRPAIVPNMKYDSSNDSSCYQETFPSMACFLNCTTT